MTPPVGVSQRHACHLAAGHTACRGARPYRLLTLGIFAVDRVWFWSVRNEGCRCCCAVGGWQCLRPTEAESDRGVRPCVNSMIITKPTQSQETTLQREKVPLGWVCFCFGRPLQGRQASSRRQGQRQQRKRTRGGGLPEAGMVPPPLVLPCMLLCSFLRLWVVGAVQHQQPAATSKAVLLACLVCLRNLTFFTPPPSSSLIRPARIRPVLSLPR
jgi:hypothetical protein